MRVVVLGLWHLGSVTAACLARHHRVTGLDFDESVVRNFRAGRAPLLEPGLDELIAQGVTSGRLDFSSDAKVAGLADVLWICYDTPVDANDHSDVGWVMSRLNRVLLEARSSSVVLISSQLPVGTYTTLAKSYPHLQFACSPENLRLGKAIETFEKPARIVLGVNPGAIRETLTALLAPLGAPFVWMKPESAEMVKHALNSFLALSIAYINEVAILSEAFGADAREVATGLKSDPRIGPGAYLGPGGPFAGGTLARDVVMLTQLSHERNVPLTLIPAIKESNDRHRSWALRKLQNALDADQHSTVAVLGLAYTPNTNTLRRSAAVELCRQLLAKGIEVRAFDPLIRVADVEHSDLPLTATVEEALRGAHAVVICTEWPQFRDYAWPSLIATMTRPIVIDANRHLERAVAAAPGVIYLTVGRP